MMKLDFQRAVLNRVPEMAKNPKKHFREVFFVCDEYQNFATCWRKRANRRREVFQPLAPAQMHPDCATQSISSLKSVLPGETWRTLLQTFRTKIFSRFQMTFSAAPQRALRARRQAQG